MTYDDLSLNITIRHADVTVIIEYDPEPPVLHEIVDDLARAFVGVGFSPLTVNDALGTSL